LTERNEEDRQDNDYQRWNCTWLLLDIVWCKSLNRYSIKGVVVQRPDPASAEPKNRLLELRREICQRLPRTIPVHDKHDKSGGKVFPHRERDEFVVIRKIRRVRRQCDVVKQRGINCEEEDWGGSGEEGD